MDPIFALAIRLPPRGSRSVLRSLHRQLREAILERRLQPGLRLPATRAFAAALRVSRNTAVAVYDLLASEGYLITKLGAGSYVASGLPERARAGERPVNRASDRRLSRLWRATPLPLEPDRGSFDFDFRVGLSDNSRFSYQVWKRLSARALRAISRTPVSYAEPEGRPLLRQAIARHVSFTRAVACSAEDIVVTTGAQQAFDLLSRILTTPGETVVAVEEPGYPSLRAAFVASGADVRAVPVDGEGLRVDRLPKTARVICVTPSHQFPLGMAMSLARRSALLEFARKHGAVVVEDDYDGEFRFGGRPLDALQTLDRAESVFYVGTFSKSLFPALRLGFVVAPAWARRALVAAKRLADWHTPVLAQGTLADFIAEGHLARHVGKMRKIYAERRGILLQALSRHCADRLIPIPGDAGLHLAARLDSSCGAGQVVAKAAERGIRIQSLDRYSVAKTPPNGLAFGYGMIRTDRIEEAVRRLAQAMA